MLINFRIKNYKSFRDNVEFDMTALKDVTDYDHHVIHTSNDGILVTSAIFGTNGYGKSNFIDAFNSMRNIILHQNGIRSIEPLYFAFDESNKESEFEMWFTLPENDDIVYNYGYSFTHNCKNCIRDEWLNVKLNESKKYERIFLRENYNSIEFFDKDLKEYNSSNPIDSSISTLILSSLKFPLFEKIKSWFASIDILSNDCMMNSIINNRTNMYCESEMPTNFFTDETVRKNVIEYLHKFDKSITAFVVERIDNKCNTDEKSKYLIYTKHLGSETLLPFNQESDGIRKMIYMYQHIRNALEYGTVLIIDNMEMYLQPLLERNIVLSFINLECNLKHSQLIFTTHDTTLMQTNLFRRDEIWIVDKDLNGKSDLYSIMEFANELQYDRDSLMKRYLDGRYGGI